MRTPKERKEFHIESLHIPLDELSERQNEIPQDKKLLVYCKSGVRSAHAIAILKENSFKNKMIKSGNPSQDDKKNTIIENLRKKDNAKSSYFTIFENKDNKDKNNSLFK